MMTMTSDLPNLEAELAGGAPWRLKVDETKTRHGSAIWHMEKVTTPVLILHGEKDERVPLTQAIAFYRGCEEHKVPCEMIIYPREPHVVEERMHRIDMLNRIKDFIETHMVPR